MRILKKIITLTAIVIVLISCNTQTQTQTPKTADQLKEELKVQEQINPTAYLSVTASLKENITREPDLFHHTETDGYILFGSIKNSSTVTKFKDVVIIVTYLSETQTAIDTKEYVMYKYFEPNSERPYEYKVYPSAGYKNFSVEVKTATAVN